MKPQVSLIVPLVAATFSWAVSTSPVLAQSIIDEWAMVKAPPPPKLEPVTVDPKTTALLVLDLMKQTCNKEESCLASLPRVAKLIAGARASDALVVYSIILGSATLADTLPEVKPVGEEPVVKAGPDKFIGTDLEKILKDKDIATLIVVGTAANGAVLYTASHAALLGFNVVVPVDGMSAEPYAEQYVAWNMIHAPVLSAKVKLTASDMVRY